MRLGIVLGALGSVLAAYKRRLGRVPGRHGAVLGAPRAKLEQSGELPRPFWTRPDSSWQHLADLLNFIVVTMFFLVFSMVFIDFSAPRSGSEGLPELWEASSELLTV